MQTKLINFPYKQDILAISIHVNNIGIYVRANCLNGVMFYVWYAIVQTSKIWFHRQMAKATMEKWIFPLIWHGFIFSVIELAQVSSHTSTFLFLCLNTFCDWRNTKTPLWNNLVPRFGFLIPVRLFYRAVVLYFTLLYFTVFAIMKWVVVTFVQSHLYSMIADDTLVRARGWHKIENHLDF